MKKLILLSAVVLAAGILCSCSSTPTYNFGTEDEYRLGDALLNAIAQRENAAAMQLINRGAPLNYRDKKDEWTPLVYAIYYDNWSIAEFLIRAGVNVDLRDQANRTALMWCAMRGDLTVLRLLIEHGADLNAVDIGGRKALHYALTYNHGGAAKYLAEIGKLPAERRIRAAHSTMAEEAGKKRQEITTAETVPEVPVAASPAEPPKTAAADGEEPTPAPSIPPAAEAEASIAGSDKK